jgi:uncharacterized protein
MTDSASLRVVIDTNLVLSALVFGGSTAKLRWAWQNDRLTPLASKATITELLRVLAYSGSTPNEIDCMSEVDRYRQ